MSRNDGETSDRVAPRSADRLGVVIVHYGDPEPTLRCIAALEADPSPILRSIAVVDNSGDLRLPQGRSTRDVEVVSSADNPGFGEGANRGVRWLRDRLAASRIGVRGWVILNGDVEVAAGFLTAAARGLAPLGEPLSERSEPGFQAVGGPIYRDRIGGDLWFAGGRTRPLSGTVFQSRRPEDAERRREVGFLTGAALAVEAGLWESLGGFDPRFFLYNEDLDLCLRIRRLGGRLGFLPEMVSLHHVGAATGSGRRSPLYLEHLTKTRLLPYPSRTHRLYLAVLHTGWVLFRAARFALAGGRENRARSSALLRGHRQALRTLWSNEKPTGGR